MYAIRNKKTGLWLYGTDYRYNPPHQRTSLRFSFARKKERRRDENIFMVAWSKEASAKEIHSVPRVVLVTERGEGMV